MNSHLRANLLLLGLTMVLCCVLYPLALWAVGGALFPSTASGSLVEANGKAVGSRLIGQPFTKDEYFQPRPSAVGYNATASGGSNWGANNPKLRDRVARQLGPIVKYNPAGPKKDDSVQADIEAWFAAQRDVVRRWAADNPTLATVWVNAEANKPAALAWLGAADAGDDLAKTFFESWAAAHPNQWPEPKDGKFQPVATGADLQATFFDSWLRAHPRADLQKVPADMVLASGSGLDPHITVRNAKYQLGRVAAARNATAADIAELIDARAFTPLSGLVGEPLVNVLELNLELDAMFPVPPAKTPGG
jgi:potassium-transporting ATPase KdpC subunit